MTQAGLSDLISSHHAWLNDDQGECLNLTKSTLHSFDFSGETLSRSIMRGVDCRQSNFSKASLYGVNFEFANAQDCDFSGSNLRNASFHSTDLRGADFHAANLRGANFEGATLHGASLRFADLKGARLHHALINADTLVGADIAEGWTLADRAHRIYDIEPSSVDGEPLFVEAFETFRGWYIRTNSFEGSLEQFVLCIRDRHGHDALGTRLELLVRSLIGRQ